ncbi:ATP-binding protein [Desulfamplus magnetovallimortis]|uniref:ATP-binding protein n=1 Tax=Desulfamplus magnetovallimortis TaxID=1246637 RepID=UPI00111B6BCF|nr:ATP-binding protein [Desulfamplus magnetovallimortis]
MNPFGTSRVDSPFQEHTDLKSLFSEQFMRLKSLVREIASDPNHQSTGVVLAGNPGSGKTHLIMRLAREMIAANRILFIRQPNNPESILYHIYSRMLESLVERVPGTSYTQIQYLLARSFSNIIINVIKQLKNPSENMKSMEALLSQSHLNIYRGLGGDDTETRRKNWKFIEKRTLEWWGDTHGFGGQGSSIVKALIKYCSYSDIGRREMIRKWLAGHELSETELKSTGLENRGESTGFEAFAIEAIRVLGKLSIEDEPLIVVFDQLEGLKYNEELLISFGEAVKELFTHIPNTLMIFNLFPERWEAYSAVFNPSVVERIGQNTVFLNTPSKNEMKEILACRAREASIDISSLFTEEEMDKISNGESIRKVLNNASDYFRFKKDKIPLPQPLSSFKDQILMEIRHIKEEISWLKKHLNLSVPAFQETGNTEKIKKILESYRKYEASEYEKHSIINDADDAGKLQVMLRAMGRGTQLKAGPMKKGRKAVPENIMVRTSSRKTTVTGFLHIKGNSFTSRLKNFNDLAENHPESWFQLFRDERQEKITSKVAMQEILRLNNHEKGSFIIMERENRILFESLYRLVTDIQNRDVDMDIEDAIKVIKKLYSDYWLIRLLDAGQK